MLKKSPFMLLIRLKICSSSHLWGKLHCRSSHHPHPSTANPASPSHPFLMFFLARAYLVLTSFSAYFPFFSFTLSPSLSSSLSPPSSLFPVCATRFCLNHSQLSRLFFIEAHPYIFPSSLSFSHTYIASTFSYALISRMSHILLSSHSSLIALSSFASLSCLFHLYNSPISLISPSSPLPHCSHLSSLM